MPFPWKKAKVSRISQLVADLQAPKHGGSLMVETGFPNSLIDLFVMNQDRLKNKPSSKKNKKKKKKRNDDRSVEISDTDAIVRPATLPPPISENSITLGEVAVSRIGNHLCRQNFVNEDGKDLFVEDQAVVVSENNNVKRSDSIGIFLSILKILITVVLAMATKKLAVGITLSAFVLLFIEYAGKIIVPYLESSSKLLANLRFRNEIYDSESCGLIRKSNDIGDGKIVEIKIGESKTDLIAVHDEHIQDPICNSNLLNYSNSYERKEEKVITMRSILEQDEDVMEEITDHKKPKHSRGAKFKAKMLKKFAPNKSRDSKKDKNCIVKESELRFPEVSIYHQSEDKLRTCEYQEQQGQCKKIEANEIKSSSQGEKREKIDESCRKNSPNILTGQTILANEKLKIEKKMKLRSLILILVILVGLLGGRTIALLLCFGWWLCLKSVSILNNQSNLPMMIRNLLS